MPEGDKSSTSIVEHRSSDVYEHEPIPSECPSGGGGGELREFQSVLSFHSIYRFLLAIHMAVELRD